MNFNGIAHELWAVAQLLPNEGIEDGVARIEKLLREEFKEQANKSFDAMLTTGSTSKAKRAPRRHKKHRKPDMLDRFSAMLERKEATGYSWLEDETPGKDW
jgi:hypothetical protein